MHRNNVNVGQVIRINNAGQIVGEAEPNLEYWYGFHAVIFDPTGDGNNVVDGLDFLKWQRGESPQPLSSFDLAAWELNFGETFAPPLAALVATPEPSTMLLAR